MLPRTTAIITFEFPCGHVGCGARRIVPSALFNHFPENHVEREHLRHRAFLRSDRHFI